MAKIIAVAMDKGGSGKTTTAVAVATGLHQRGKRTLLMGLDPQADAERHVGLDPRQLGMTINTLLTKIGVDPHDAITKTSFGLDILPANKDLDATDRSMKATNVGILKPIIEALSDDYDYIVIDTRRTGSLLTISAFVAATDVLITLEAEYLAMENLSDTMVDISEVQQGLNPGLKILGILLTKVRSQTRLARTIIEEIEKNEIYRQYLLPIHITNTIKHAEASYAGLPIQLYAPDAAVDYGKLVEIIDHA